MKEKLREQIDILTDEMYKTAPGTEEYERMCKALAELNKQMLAIEKQDADIELADREFDLKEKNAESSRKADIWGKILQGLGIAVPAAVAVWGGLKTFQFEETGTICSTGGRNFIGNLLRSKK